MEPSARKEVLRLVPYGLYAVTVGVGDEANAFCLSWLTQVSFEPPLVLVAVRPDSLSHLLIDTTGELVVHFVHKRQAAFIRKLFQPLEREPEKLAGCELAAGTLSPPILPETVACLECKVVERLQPGDHALFVAEVVGARRFSDEEPLLLSDTPWHYGG